MKRDVSKKSVIESVSLKGHKTGHLPQDQSVNIPLNGFPFFIISISIIQVIIFYVGGEVNSNQIRKRQIKTTVQEIWLFLCYDPYRRHEFWRYLSVMLTHTDWIHLWGNLTSQLFFGISLERGHGCRKIGVIYVGGVLGGSLANNVFNSKDYGFGASDGICALIGANLAIIFIKWNQMGKSKRLVWASFYIGLIFLDWIGSLFDLDLTSISPLLNLKEISYAGHIGGAFTGFIVGVLLLDNFEKSGWEKRLHKILTISFLLTITINICCPSNYYPMQFNTEYAETMHWHDIIKVVHNNKSGSMVRMYCKQVNECMEYYSMHFYPNEL